MDAPKIGQRVRLIRPFEYDPFGEIPVGATGIVIQNVRNVEGEDEDREPCKDFICIELDPDHIPKENPPEEGVISFYPDCGPLIFNGVEVEDVCLQFHLTCEYITRPYDR